MTPRERADRLFGRIMTAAERGDTSEANFFKPMALQAYAMAGEPDIDMRFHLGLILAATGDAAGVAAQRDAIAAADSTHLFGVVLAGEAARLAGDQAGLHNAQVRFLELEATERARGRSEYDHHNQLLDDFRAAAERESGR
jgi:hypothetical protein